MLCFCNFVCLSVFVLHTGNLCQTLYQAQHNYFHPLYTSVHVSQHSCYELDDFIGSKCWLIVSQFIT